MTDAVHADRMGALRATYCFALILSAVSISISQAASYDVVERSISQLSDDLEAGRVTSETLVRQYLARIEKIDKQGPALRAVLTINPNALALAKQLDIERREHRLRGPLHGIPILLKDNIETLDPMPTTAGSIALKDNQAVQDAPIVAQLRAAGAVILGKTNLSEWANFRSDKSISGWSGVGGLTKNAYVLDRSACGSSSGSAVAIASSLAAAAVGTETNGSVTCPAAMNSLVGIKPTMGLLSGDRIVPISHSHDTAGPMTRTVQDAALLLQVLANRSRLCGGHVGDQARCDVPNYSAMLAADSLRNKRIGVLRFREGLAPEVNATYERALKVLRDAGAELIETELPPNGTMSQADRQVMYSEFKADLNAYLASTPKAVTTRTLEQLIAFNQTSKRELQLFGQELLIATQQAVSLDDSKYRAALANSQRLARAEGLDKVLDKDGLDALVAPSTSAAWRVDLVSGDRFRGSFSTYPAIAGYPHITLPMGYYQEIPLGVSFIGRPWTEPMLLSLAYDFESRIKARKPPKFLPSIDAKLEGGVVMD